jgi:hypothetical protein
MTETNHFRYKDSSSATVSSSWERPSATWANNGELTMSEQQAVINDLQRSLESMTSSRDEWKAVAMSVAKLASKSPSALYGRQVDHILDLAKREL